MPFLVAERSDGPVRPDGAGDCDVVGLGDGVWRDVVVVERLIAENLV